MSYLQENSGLGNIVLSGYSPTILLDGAPHTQSFGGEQTVNMGIIANRLIKEGLGETKFDVRVSEKNKTYIVYSTQYNETHYNYLARMAVAYGEQFYYDGKVLHFGELPPPNKPIRLVYGRNVNDIHVELNAVHTRPEFYGYDSSSDVKLTSGDTPLTHRSDLANNAYKNNENIFRTKSLQVAPIKANTDMDVVVSQQSETGLRGVDVFTVSGSTTIPFLYPGCVCDLEMRKQDSNQTSYFTRIMITDVEHEMDTLGHYKGRFKAIASDTGFLPKPFFEIPIAQPQIAKVISNKDPKGQGRVTVQFDWQLHDTTDFIRVMSPDTGGTDKVTQNRGYVAIPEIGDQVMVGFVHNHPDRPFVMGGMFTGKIGLGGGINNNVKSIQTRSGIKILMNDDEGSITIIDPSGNTYLMDGKGNINITAPNDINFNAGGNFNISVGKNMTTSVGMNITNSVGMNITNNTGINYINTAGGFMKQNATLDYSLMAANITEIANGNKSSKSKEVVDFSENKKIVSEQKNEVHTKGSFNNNGGENTKMH